jgi:Beta-galactosidase/beta-glucuronidase
MRPTIFSFFLLAIVSVFAADYQPQFSVAGFHNLPNSGREVYDFNVGWRFNLGDVSNAEAVAFDDSKWDIVSTPHTVMLMPAEGSGSRNYQGVAWYRKHFTVPENLQNKLVTIYFEAAMGKSVVYLNGQKITEHLGGYLPFMLELTQYGVKAGDKALIAVKVDNSDDRNYPPGKRQTQLDFTYHGGIYRDVWLIATGETHITNANTSEKISGGGVFVQYGEISEKSAEIFISTEVKNSSKSAKTVQIENSLLDSNGKLLKKINGNISLKPNESKSIKQKINLQNPKLWHPDTPNLYKIATQVSSGKTKLDGGITRIGIRKIEFKGADGLYINNKPADKLIGGNRHQDYAYVGNALPNSQHWRDAYKLRAAGNRIIRAAHYPQDPAFMDACDELGLFMIVATPGWQYWNNDPHFAELVCDDVRNMVRRDRNHPSVIMWEPLLNETRCPPEFAVRIQELVKEELPGAVCVADNHSAGIAENYSEVVYGWPTDLGGNLNQCIFTREFAENVDDWYAHNNNNRASRSWGETPMLVQAHSLAKSYDEMYPDNRQFIGGAQWHPFDHQRGYHPDPYWGGITDAFRQPKYAYHLFASQIDADYCHPIIETAPMIYIAHEISPFSSADVTIFTNCEEVRLIVFERDTIVQKVPHDEWKMPHPPIVFKNIYDFWDMRNVTYIQKQWQKVSFVAEGLIDGKVVCSTKKMPSRRSTKLRLSIDNVGQKLIADGSDFVTVICEVTDDSGNVRRLAKDQILFTVEGEGNIIGNEKIGANPRAVEFGSAPLLVRSTLNAGKIKVHARVLFEGEMAPTSADLEFESIAPTLPALYSEFSTYTNNQVINHKFERKLSDEEKQKSLDEVELQQTEFGEKKD